MEEFYFSLLFWNNYSFTGSWNIPFTQFSSVGPSFIIIKTRNLSLPQGIYRGSCFFVFFIAFSLNASCNTQNFLLWLISKLGWQCAEVTVVSSIFCANFFVSAQTFQDKHVSNIGNSFYANFGKVVENHTVQANQKKKKKCGLHKKISKLFGKLQCILIVIMANKCGI